MFVWETPPAKANASSIRMSFRRMLYVPGRLTAPRIENVFWRRAATVTDTVGFRSTSGL